MKTGQSSIVDDLAVKYGKSLAVAQKELKKDRPKLRASYESDVMLFQKWACPARLARFVKSQAIHLGSTHRP